MILDSWTAPEQKAMATTRQRGAYVKCHYSTMLSEDAYLTAPLSDWSLVSSLISDCWIWIIWQHGGVMIEIMQILYITLEQLSRIVCSSTQKVC